MKKGITLRALLVLSCVLVTALPLLRRWAEASVLAGRGAVPGRRVVGSSSALRVERHGHAPINLSDRAVPTEYGGTAAAAQDLAEGLARPLSLASGDFDEDGVADLVSGYGSRAGGIVTLHRGNVDSLFPNSPEAQQRRAQGQYIDSPFLPKARVFELRDPPDFLGAGDFDNDGHWDVVTAARNSQALYLLPGDGHGGFGPARRIDLPGRVTTLTTGEMNLADGLVDVVVAVAGADG